MANFSLLGVIAVILSAGVAFFGFLGSLATLALIIDMNRWNGYMRLIFSLTSCQLLSDMAFFFIPYSVEDDSSQDSPLFLVQIFLFSLGSVSVALWTNLISYTLFVVVVYQRNFDLHKNFNMVRLMIMFPGFALATLNVIYRDDYYSQLTTTVIWIQLLSIIFNITIHIVVSYILREMRATEMEEINMLNTESGTRDTTATRYPTYTSSMLKPVQELARRLEYYPIVQIVALSGLVWYFFGYNLAILGPSHNASTRMVAWYSYSILSPSAGIGYFIVFLKVQPYAYSRFVAKLRDLLRLPVNRTISTQSDLCRLSSAAATRSVDQQSSSISRPSDLMRATSMGSGMALGANHPLRSVQSNTTTTSSHASETLNVEVMDEDMLISRIDELQKAFCAQEVVNSPIVRKSESNL